ERALVQLLNLLLPLLLKEDLLLAFVPHDDALVVARADEEFAAVAHRQRPHLAVVTVQPLDLLELVAVPVLDRPVLAATEEVVAVAVRVVRDEADLQNAVLVPEQRLVTVTKVEAPYPDVLVGRARHDQLAIIGYVHAEDW